MKKSGFLTFCFSFIPGAGQMYQGYMKRGVSLMALFVLAFVLYSSTGWMLFSAAMFILWCVTFFDTFHVAAMDAAARSAKPDNWVWGEMDDLEALKLTKSKNRVLGEIFIIAGIWLLLDRLPYMLEDLGVSLQLTALNFIQDNVPGLIVAALLIWLGVRFIRGPRVEDQQAYRPVQPTQEAGRDE